MSIGLTKDCAHAGAAERLRLESELLAQTQRLLLGQRSAGMVILDWDIEADELRWSDSPELFRGPLPAARRYPKWVDQVHPDDREHFLAIRAEGIRTLQPQLFEYRIIRTDGRLVWLNVVQTVLGNNAGRAERMIIAMQDVTARKRADEERSRLEAQLRESQKMEALGTLAGGVAHDFNNIITAILGNAELAAYEIESGSNAREFLDEIRKAARRARDVVNQILAFSRREPTRRRRMVLDPVLEDSVRLLRATLPARVTLQAYCAAGVPPVMADATQIQQVLINLVNNATQAMNGVAGRIEVRLDQIVLDEETARNRPALAELRQRHHGRTVRLTVSDTGCGMDAATLARVFEPFFTTKLPGQGTGLGLAVVHGIVRAHGGAVEVASDPGRGASFSIHLPVANEGTDAVEMPASGSAPASARRWNILYVDDDASLVMMLPRLLERRGFRVSAYVDPNEALNVLRAAPSAFDLVIADYNMPGMSGLDVVREVRTIRADLPVAIATGYIDETLRAQAASLGVTELIFKPVAIDDLCAVVEAILRTGDSA